MELNVQKDQFADRAAFWDSPDKVKMSEKFVAELLKHITPSKTWRALEIGSGTGLIGLRLLPLVDSLVCVDTSESMLAELRRKTEETSPVEIIHGVTEDYNQKDINFVFSNMSFHHIEDIPNLLAHLFNITTPGAIVAIGDLCSEDGSFHNFQAIPHRGFELNWLKKQFEDTGFRVLKSHPYRRLKRKDEQNNMLMFDQFILIAERE